MSTLTLVMEIIVAALIFFIIFNGSVRNIFFKKLSYFVIGYEIVFNVGYMLFRTLASQPNMHLSSLLKIVAALHGALSLLMLLAVIILFIKADKEYSKRVNYFAVHSSQTFIFIGFWVISILSGVFLYIKAYF